MIEGNKEYIGDGVYAEYDGYHFKLTTEDGISVTNTIYLDDVVVNSLFHYINRMRNETHSRPT